MVKYEVTCDHDHCHYRQEVLLPEAVGNWEPDTVSQLLDGEGQPLVKRWSGAPLEDAYEEHRAEQHPEDPPKLAWRVVE